RRCDRHHARLGAFEGTVRTDLESIYRLLQVSSRTAAVTPRLRRPDRLTPLDPRPGSVPTEPGLRVSLKPRPGPAFWPTDGQSVKKSLTCRPRPSRRDATEHQFSLALDDHRR